MSPAETELAARIARLEAVVEKLAERVGVPLPPPVSSAAGAPAPAAPQAQADRPMSFPRPTGQMTPTVGGVSDRFGASHPSGPAPSAPPARVSLDAPPAAPPVDGVDEERVLALLRAGRKLEAIRLVREQARVDIKDAAEIVERLQDRLV